MKSLNVKPLIAVILTAGSLSAMAADPVGFYAGGSLGTPNYGSTVNGNSGNGSGTSGKVFGGYQFNQNFALEAGYVNLGNNDGNVGSVSSTGQFIDAVGTMPVSDKWSLLGRMGVSNVNISTTTGNDTGTGLKLGLGAQYSLTRTVGLRAEWERYQPQVFGSVENIDQYTIGVKVAF